MRKSILLLAVLSVSAGCVPDHDKIRYDSVWYVENLTDQTLMIAPPPYGMTGPYTLAPGEKVEMYSRSEYGNSPYFEMIMVLWRGVDEENISFDLASADGTPLAGWKFSGDGYGYSQGKRFFRSSSWEHSSDYKKRKRKKAAWTFEILPEDIQRSVEP